MFQILWCCRQSGTALYIFAFVAALCSLTSISLGTYIAVAFGNYTRCQSYFNVGGDGDNTIDGEKDYCPEILWAIWSWSCGALWSIVSICTFCFVKSGRHARYEEKYSSTTAIADSVVEFHTVVAADVEPSTSEDFVPIVVPIAVLASDP